MYFSVLPLLLLFASTICASPVHIGRRTDTTLINGVEFPISHHVDHLYRHLRPPHRCYEQRIDGVDVAVKKTFVAGGDIMLVRVEVFRVDVVYVKKLIDNLGEALIAWKWDFVLDGYRVVFILEMKQEGEEKIRTYLSILHVDELPNDHKDHDLHTHALELLKSANRIQDVDQAWEMRDERDDVLMKVIVKKIDYGRVKMLIADLDRGGNLLSWGWSISYDCTSVSIRLKGEVYWKVKEYLALN